MSTVTPGWYSDPADPATQRYWDGEGWLGDPLPAGTPAPAGPPPEKPKPAPVAAPTGQPSAAPAGGADADKNGSAKPQAPPGWPQGYPYPYPRTAPPPKPHGLALAGAGTRLAARLVDVLAVAGLCAIANSWFAYQWWQAAVPYLRQVTDYQTNGGTMPEAPAAVSNLFLMMCLVATAVWFAYEVPGSANSGQTMGKRLMGIRVVRLESGDRLGFGRSFRRWGRLGLPTLLWPCFGVGLLLQFLDCLYVAIDRPLRQALHDKAAVTVVVRVARTGSAGKSQLSDAAQGGRHADPR